MYIPSSENFILLRIEITRKQISKIYYTDIYIYFISPVLFPISQTYEPESLFTLDQIAR